MSRVVTLAAAVLLASAAPASAQTVTLFGFAGQGQELSHTAIPAHVSGSLKVSFHGDQATGCVAYGLCPYSGTDTWVPARSGQVDVFRFRKHGRTHALAIAIIGFAGQGRGTFSKVTRAGGGTCADAQPDALDQLAATVHGRVVSMRLDGRGSTTFQTRCAGPLDGDLRSALTVRRVPLARLLRGRLAVDLGGAQAFAAHGFAGTVTSTVELRLGKPKRQRRHPPPPPGFRTVKQREVEVSYRVAAASGGLGARITGASDPTECALLDSCGLTGTLAERVPARAAGIVTVIGPVRRPRADFLAALGLSRHGDPQGLQAFGGIELRGVPTVSERTLQDGLGCRDATTMQPALSIELSGGHLRARYAGESESGTGPRTRCPGPLLVGSPAWIAPRSRSTAPLRKQTTTLRLVPGPTRSDDGYTLAPAGTLRVTLTRTRIRERVINGLAVSPPRSS
jgi:hypothetical protein